MRARFLINQDTIINGVIATLIGAYITSTVIVVLDVKYHNKVIEDLDDTIGELNTELIDLRERVAFNEGKNSSKFFDRTSIDTRQTIKESISKGQIKIEPNNVIISEEIKPLIDRYEITDKELKLYDEAIKKNPNQKIEPK